VKNPPAFFCKFIIFWESLFFFFLLISVGRNLLELRRGEEKRGEGGKKRRERGRLERRGTRRGGRGLGWKLDTRD